MAVVERNRPPSDSAPLLDHLSFWAKHEPARLAVSNGRRMLGYAEFFRWAETCRAGLDAFGIKSGHLVAIGLSDPFGHWLLAIAAEALGATTFSFSPSLIPTPDMRRLLERTDVVLVDQDGPNLATDKTRLCDERWWRALFAADGKAKPVDGPYQSPSPVRIIRSSGTTGEAKAIPIERPTFTARVRHAIETEDFTPESRFLLTHPFTVAAAFTRAAACLWLGATLIVGPSQTALREEEPSHLYLMPNDLALILDSLPPQTPLLSERVITVTGAPLAPALKAEAIFRLGGRVCSAYGTNETGIVAFVEEGGIAALFALCRARFLGPDGEPAPSGEAGFIALRGPDMAFRYYEETDTTANRFRDGWFLTNDLGVALDDRHFRLIGRADDLLNLGGRKILPEQLEQALTVHPIQAALLGMADNDLLIGLVPMSNASWETVQAAAKAALEKHLPNWRGTMRFIRLTALPRTENGKPRRAALKDMV